GELLRRRHRTTAHYRIRRTRFDVFLLRVHEETGVEDLRKRLERRFGRAQCLLGLRHESLGFVPLFAVKSADRVRAMTNRGSRAGQCRLTSSTLAIETFATELLNLVERHGLILVVE